MAIYHCKISNVSRGADGAGRSSVASAAYRAGENLYNEREEKRHNFTGRVADIYHEGIYTPSERPEWTHKRGKFWNRVEVAERYKNARTAKEIVVALPYELKREQFLEPLLKYVQDNIISKYQIAVDVAIHRYGKARMAEISADAREIENWKKEGLPFLADKIADKTDTPHVKIVTGAHDVIKGYKLYQPHAHIMMPLREFDDSTVTGFAKVKNRMIDRRDQILQWRERWQDCLNSTFQRLGLSVRVSCLPKKAANDNAGGADEIEGFSYSTHEISAPEGAKQQKQKAANDQSIKPVVKRLISGADAPQNLTSQLAFLEKHRLARLRADIAASHLPDAGDEATDRLFQAWAAIHDQIGGFNDLNMQGGGR